MAATQQSDSVIKFLIGLHESYAQIRSQLLLSSPLPSLAKVYSLLLQEDLQRLLQNSLVLPTIDSMAMVAKNSTNPRFQFQKDKKRPRCTHCGFNGHTVDKCFQIIGYPPGWKGPKGSRNTKDHAANVVVVSPPNSEQADNPLFSQDMFQQFLTYAKQHQHQSQACTPLESVTHTAATTISGYEHQEDD